MGSGGDKRTKKLKYRKREGVKKYNDEFKNPRGEKKKKQTRTGAGKTIAGRWVYVVRRLRTSANAGLRKPKTKTKIKFKKNKNFAATTTTNTKAAAAAAATTRPESVAYATARDGTTTTSDRRRRCVTHSLHNFPT